MVREKGQARPFRRFDKAGRPTPNCLAASVTVIPSWDNALPDANCRRVHGRFHESILLEQLINSSVLQLRYTVQADA